MDIYRLLYLPTVRFLLLAASAAKGHHIASKCSSLVACHAGGYISMSTDRAAAQVLIVGVVGVWPVFFVKAWSPETYDSADEPWTDDGDRSGLCRPCMQIGVPFKLDDLERRPCLQRRTRSSVVCSGSGASVPQREQCIPVHLEKGKGAVRSRERQKRMPHVQTQKAWDHVKPPSRSLGL
jgi:hypothetical protein